MALCALSAGRGRDALTRCAPLMSSSVSEWSRLSRVGQMLSLLAVQRVQALSRVTGERGLRD